MHLGLCLGLTQSRPAVSEGGGGEEPDPPPEGFAYIVNGEGKYLTSGDGAYVIAKMEG